MNVVSYMVKITLGKKSEEVKDSPIDAFEKIGVNFDCQSGTCGLCKIKVLEGMKNINQKTEAEDDFPLEDEERLACQCHKITGDIKIENADW